MSDYFTGSFSHAGMQFMDTIVDATPNLSVITQIELLCWKIDVITEQKVTDFIDDSIVLHILPQVIIQCVNLRKGKKIKTPDAIVAATALAYGYTLINNNEKDFVNIPNLKVVNPYSV